MSTALGVCIAFLGLCIAWGQYFTARQKLVLDLFQRRVECVEAIDALVMKALTNGLDANLWSGTLQAHRTTARYLFGPEVQSYLADLDTSVWSRLWAWQSRDDNRSEEDRARYTDDMRKGGRMLTDYRWISSDLFAPYLRMDHKLPRPPEQWLDILAAELKRRWNSRPTGEE